jgi:hypothetical protein
MSVFHRVEDQCQYPVNCCGSTPYRNLLTEGSINSINFLGFKLPIKFTYHAVSVVRAECLGVDFPSEKKACSVSRIQLDPLCQGSQWTQPRPPFVLIQIEGCNI